MTATVTQVNPVKARVRRRHTSETVYLTRANSEQLAELKVGDRIEVQRQPNNPYLVFVERK